MTINTSSSSTSTTIKTASISKKFAFTYDHPNQKIVGTDINFQKAGIPGSDLEKELLARMAGQPTYTFEVITTDKKPEKRSYAGLTMDLMEDYLAIWEHELADTARAKFAEMKAKQEKKELRFSFIKSWFLELFPKFDVKKAKKEIREKKFKDAKAPYKVVKVSIAVPQMSNN